MHARLMRDMNISSGNQKRQRIDYKLDTCSALKKFTRVCFVKKKCQFLSLSDIYLCLFLPNCISFSIAERTLRQVFRVMRLFHSLACNSISKDTIFQLHYYWYDFKGIFQCNKTEPNKRDVHGLKFRQKISRMTCIKCHQQAANGQNTCLAYSL